MLYMLYIKSCIIYFPTILLQETPTSAPEGVLKLKIIPIYLIL